LAYPGRDPTEGRPIVNPGDESFFVVGGERQALVRYVILRDGQFELIEAEEEFRSIFAPVGSPNEALSYALAVRNLSAYYDLAPESRLEYFVEEIQDTHVEPTEDGYIVHLFDYDLFGCGPHLTYAVEVWVSTQGDVAEIRREQIFHDPKQDNLCVD
jgi:hypothetical protein